MIERCQQICLTLKVLHNRLAHQWVWRHIDHFLHGNQFNHVREVHIPRAVDRAHSTNTNYILNIVTIHQGDASH